jgi:hypothetical protein
MNHVTVSSFANILSALSAFVAAGFWWKASRAKMRPNRTPDSDDWTPGGITSAFQDGSELDPIATMWAGAELNARAAVAAAIAAVLQGAAIILGIAGL